MTKLSRKHFTYRVGDSPLRTLDGRNATVIHAASDGFAVLAHGDDRWVVDPDGKAYDRNDTLLGFKPSSDAYMRIWHP